MIPPWEIPEPMDKATPDFLPTQPGTGFTDVWKVHIFGYDRKIKKWNSSTCMNCKVLTPKSCGMRKNKFSQRMQTGLVKRPQARLGTSGVSKGYMGAIPSDTVRSTSWLLLCKASQGDVGLVGYPKSLENKEVLWRMVLY
jgi:hypothetical protein